VIVNIKNAGHKTGMTIVNLIHVKALFPLDHEPLGASLALGENCDCGKRWQNSIRDLSTNRQVQLGRCNGREIERRREEMPSLLCRKGLSLGAVKAIKLHRVLPFSFISR
jgi:hypothetical protein